MDLATIFICNLKKWRKASGLSQKSLAEKCGASHSYVRQIENGAGYPSFAMMAKIAEVLEIAPYQLLYDEASAPGQAARKRHLESVKGRLLEAVAGDIQAAFGDLKEASSAPPSGGESPP